MTNPQHQPADSLGPVFALLRDNKRADAVAWLTEYIERKPDDPRALMQLGELLRHGPDIIRGINLLERALRTAPTLTLGWLSYAAALRTLSRPDGAKAAYRRVLALDPNRVEALNDLATLLMDERDWATAVDLLARACELRPETLGLQMNLAEALAQDGRTEDAAKVAHSVLALDSTDPVGAGMLLSKIGQAPTPLQAPESLLQPLYSLRASRWDAIVTGERPYRGAALVAEACATYVSKSSDVLDAGCGTGLVGELLCGSVGRMVGVDISEPMLSVARTKKLYSELVKADMVNFMRASPGKFDAVTCAATLIHFGDLVPVFEAAAICIRNQGVFVFTVFPNDDKADIYSVRRILGSAQGGLFDHGASYLAAAARQAGFEMVDLRRELHEYVGLRPDYAYVVTLRIQ
jgi:predicted TPR repeat methyltransferase